MINQLDESVRADLIAASRDSTRLRSHHLMHKSEHCPVQRMLVAVQMGSYFQPHRHNREIDWELLVVLSGRLAVLVFDANGRVVERVELVPAGESCFVEIAAGTVHTMAALAPDSLFIEIKQGPYPGVGYTTVPDWVTEAERIASPPAIVTWLAGAQKGDVLSATAPNLRDPA